MTDTPRFQPGDKVRVKPSSAAVLGLTTNATHTIAHVNDFGQLALRGGSSYYHPSHFELVMRAVADETCCLVDVTGDWWVSDDGETFRWVCSCCPVGEGTLLTSLEEALTSYGPINAEPTAPAETYCLKDGEGDWWVYDAAGEGYLFAEGGTLSRSLDYLASAYGIDTAESFDAGGEYETEMALAYEEPGNSTGPSLHFEAEPAFAVGDRVEYIGGGDVETERLIGKFGTVAEVGNPMDDDAIVIDWDENLDPRGVLAANLRKVDRAPLAVGDWVKVLARVEQVFDNGSIKAQTFQSDGSDNGPRIYAIASAITRTDEVPEWARVRSPRDRIATLIADMGHAEQSAENIANEILAQWDVTERHTEGTN